MYKMLLYAFVLMYLHKQINSRQMLLFLSPYSSRRKHISFADIIYLTCCFVVHLMSDDKSQNLK